MCLFAACGRGDEEPYISENKTENRTENETENGGEYGGSDNELPLVPLG